MSYLREKLPLELPSTDEVDEVGRVLLDAADYMEKYGHCRGQSVDERGRVCVIGAISEAARGCGLRLDIGAICRLGATIEGGCVASFSDSHPTSVLNARLRSAARAAP